MFQFKRLSLKRAASLLSFRPFFPCFNSHICNFHVRPCTLTSSRCFRLLFHSHSLFSVTFSPASSPHMFACLSVGKSRDQLDSAPASESVPFRPRALIRSSPICARFSMTDAADGPV